MKWRSQDFLLLHNYNLSPAHHSSTTTFFFFSFSILWRCCRCSVSSSNRKDRRLIPVFYFFFFFSPCIKHIFRSLTYSSAISAYIVMIIFYHQANLRSPFWIIFSHPFLEIFRFKTNSVCVSNFSIFNNKGDKKQEVGR